MLAVVAALHVLAALALLFSWRHPQSASPERIAFRIIAPKTRALPPAIEPVPERLVRSTKPSPSIQLSEVQPAAIAPQAPAVMAAQAPVEAASAPMRLDPGVTARVIAEAVRQPSYANQGRVRDGKAMPSLGQRLEAGATRAGRRDCLNDKVNPGAVGDTTMKYSPIPVGGVLALPFAVADALTGKCGL